MADVRVFRVLEDGYYTYWLGVTDQVKEMMSSGITSALIKLGEDEDVVPTSIMHKRMKLKGRHILRHYEKTGVLRFDGMDLKIKFDGGHTITFRAENKGSISGMGVQNV